jgi:type IV secretory pathway VirB10-like protein
MFLSTIRPPGRSKISNIAAAVTAVTIIVGAGYFGAMSGKKTTTPDTAPTAESAVAKVEPTPPVATSVAQNDPAPPPAAPAEPPPPPRTPEPVAETAPAPLHDTPREAPAAKKPTADEEAPRPRKTRTTRPASDDDTAAPETRSPDSNETAAKPTIDQGALRAAFAEGETKAKSCLGASSPSGTARISVTFATSGEAVGATVSGSPFQGTLEGQCMAAKFRSLRVPAFSGNEVIVRKSIKFL